MADSATSTAQMPPPSASAGAPGYDATGQTATQQHMPPPPLAPVIIPQNTNPIPTAISSPMSANVMSPTSAGPGYVPRRAAPEPNKRALYVGGLDPRVTEDVLRQIFETTGHVQSVKIIPDKNVSKNFAFPSAVAPAPPRAAQPSPAPSPSPSPHHYFLFLFFSTYTRANLLLRTRADTNSVQLEGFQLRLC